MINNRVGGGGGILLETFRIKIFFKNHGHNLKNRKTGFLVKIKLQVVEKSAFYQKFSWVLFDWKSNFALNTEV